MVPRYVGGHANVRVLVVCSFMDATVEISFLKPAASSPDDIQVAVLDERTLQIMEAEGRSIDIVLHLQKTTHLVLCRYFGEHYDRLLAAARSAGIPVITFLDDDLLNVPLETGNDVFLYFQQPHRRDVLRRAVADAELLIVSTPQLGTSLAGLRNGKPLYVLPIYRSVEKQELALIAPPDEKEKVIGYMASQSHADDFALYVPGLTRFLERRTDFRFEFFGTISPPTAFEEFGDRIYRHPKAHSYEEFQEKLRRLRWTVGLAPLRNSPFNANKADTKWVEYTLASIPTVASESNVYAVPLNAQACLSADADTLEPVLHRIVDAPQERRDLLCRSEKLLATKYPVEQHLALLIGTLRSL